MLFLVFAELNFDGGHFLQGVSIVERDGEIAHVLGNDKVVIRCLEASL